MKRLLIVIFLLTVVSSAISQTGYRIRMLANLAQHPFVSGSDYSALWGYTAPNGREYAILGCWLGTAFIDITDTTNIHEVDFLPSPDPSQFSNVWREMKTYSHYAYIVSELNNSKIQIVDLQYLPDSIRYVGMSNLAGHSTTHSISQSGPYLYLNGVNPAFSDGIAVVDLSVNPEVPILRGSWQNLSVHDSRIVNDTIWACNLGDGKVSIINAVNKDNLTLIRDWVNFPPPNAPHNIAFTNNRRYAFVTDETIFPSPGRLKLWDVGDINNIIYISSFNPAPFDKSVVHNVEIHNNFAFLAYYTAGVKVLNISNPLNPIEIGWFDTYPKNNFSEYDGCWGVYFFPSGKIIASDQENGIYVLRPNLTNPVSARPSANFSVSEFESRKYDTLTLIDATDGIPTSWQWTVTGPENKTSTLKHPRFQFQTVGQYNVKLRAGNSFGSDSIFKTNAFKVIPASLTSFNITSPIGSPIYRIITSPTDTSRVLFRWTRSALDTAIRYKLHFRKAQGPYEIFLPSSNNGKDTFSLLTKSFLDSLALQIGLTGDSVTVVFKAKAYNELDSLACVNATPITLRRNTVGINILGENIPQEYRLYDNYPNPFNPTTKINFDIPKRDIITLILYDITGREISKLFTGNIEAGSYAFTLNGNNLNSGVYFIRLLSNTFNSSIKIILMK